METISTALFLEDAFSAFLEQEKKENIEKATEVFEIIEKYLTLIYTENENDELYLEDLTSFEIDDILEFYLKDNFKDYKQLQKKVLWILRRFFKWAKKNKAFSPEQEEEWKEILK